VEEARWLKKGKSLPVWVFPSLDGTALEERNIRHVFARMLTKVGLHYMPDPTHRDVDGLDDNAPTPLDASQAHPEDDAMDLDVELSALNCVVSRI
jgi:hypothetical protein